MSHLHEWLYTWVLVSVPGASGESCLGAMVVALCTDVTESHFDTIVKTTLTVLVGVAIATCIINLLLHATDSKWRFRFIMPWAGIGDDLCTLPPIDVRWVPKASARRLVRRILVPLILAATGYSVIMFIDREGSPPRTRQVCERTGHCPAPSPGPGADLTPALDRIAAALRQDRPPKPDDKVAQALEHVADALRDPKPDSDHREIVALLNENNAILKSVLAGYRDAIPQLADIAGAIGKVETALDRIGGTLKPAPPAPPEDAVAKLKVEVFVAMNAIQGQLTILALDRRHADCDCRYRPQPRPLGPVARPVRTPLRRCPSGVH